MTEQARVGGTTFSYDKTYEMCFDGEIGSLFSIDAKGHLDDRDVELFMASVVAEEIGWDEPLVFGIEVTHAWRVEHPWVPDDANEVDDDYSERWTFSYSEQERKGAEPVTKFSLESPWSAPRLSPGSPRVDRNRRTGEFDVIGVDYYPVMCVNHPDETATTGFPEQQVIEPESVLDGYVYMCRECADSFSRRLSEARRRALAEMNAS